MLTRLEADGFKNLVDFSVDFGPLTCIAGPNGVGKSNLFDAIEFLSLLADHTLVEAATHVRGMGTETGDLRDLFSTDGRHRRDRLRLVAEMIVEKDVRDDFGRSAEATSTFLRYEVEIGFEEESDETSLGRLVLHAERLDYFTEGEAVRRLRFPHSASAFRESVVINRRRARSGYISTHESGGEVEIHVSQDGGSRGPAQRSPAHDAPRTIVGTSNTSATPTILAARREMQSWRLLSLEPSAMRRPDRFEAERSISAEGGHLAATLQRLAEDAEESGSSRENVYSEVAARLALLVPIRDLGVTIDRVRRLLTIEVEETSGVRLPASSLSDGTLRFLALAILGADAQAQGLVCFEEPENGMHPAKVQEMVDLIRDLAVDAQEVVDEDNVLRQVIIATHSPVLVQLQNPADVLVARDALVRSPSGRPLRVLRCLPLDGTWRERAGERAVGRGSLVDYLTTPVGAQLSLPAVA